MRTHTSYMYSCTTTWRQQPTRTAWSRGGDHTTEATGTKKKERKETYRGECTYSRESPCSTTRESISYHSAVFVCASSAYPLLFPMIILGFFCCSRSLASLARLLDARTFSPLSNSKCCQNTHTHTRCEQQRPTVPVHML